MKRTVKFFGFMKKKQLENYRKAERKVKILS